MQDIIVKAKKIESLKKPPIKKTLATWFALVWFEVELSLAREKNFFVENLSMLLSSGMTVVSSVRSIASEVSNRSLQKVLNTLAEDVENGSPLWRAFLNAKIFPMHVVTLVRTGEESGKLAQNLRLVAIQSEKDRNFRSKIKSAMMYPVFIFTVTIVVGVLIMWFILPRLATVFGQLRLELPALTKALIASGAFLGKHGAWVIPLFFFVLFAILYFLFSFKKTKHIGQYLLLSFPGVGGLIKEIEVSRFGYLLGTLLSAGIPVVSALESLERATTFPAYQKLYKHLRISITDGNSFEKSFNTYKKSNTLVPRTIQSLIVAGERSGSLSNTLVKISERYESKIEDTTKNLSVIFEPILLVIVWVGVVMVALSVILPIYSLIGGLNN